MDGVVYTRINKNLEKQCLRSEGVYRRLDFFTQFFDFFCLENGNKRDKFSH